MANVVRIQFDFDSSGNKQLYFNGFPIQFVSVATLTGYIDINYDDLSVSGEPIVSYTNTAGQETTQGLHPGTLLYSQSTNTYSYYNTGDGASTNDAPFFTYQGQTPSVINDLNLGAYYDVRSNEPVTSIANPPPLCFASGTRIRTARGDVAVEKLVVDDIVVTAAGEHRPIRWLGSRLTHCRRHAEPHNVLPVRVRAGAFGPTRPARDLVVSPGHALAFDICGEVLVPALALVNGSTIVQEDVDTVTYWHVELDSHDLLIAEGVPAESYLDMGNRGFFAGEGVVALGGSPDATTIDRTGFCRPFHGVGPVVEAVRARLRAPDAAERIARRG